MNIDDLVRAARPRPAHDWYRSDAGQRVLDLILTTAPEDRSMPRRTLTSRRLLLDGARPPSPVATAPCSCRAATSRGGVAAPDRQRRTRSGHPQRTHRRPDRGRRRSRRSRSCSRRPSVPTRIPTSGVCTSFRHRGRIADRSGPCPPLHDHPAFGVGAVGTRRSAGPGTPCSPRWTPEPPSPRRPTSRVAGRGSPTRWTLPGPTVILADPGPWKRLPAPTSKPAGAHRPGCRTDLLPGRAPVHRRTAGDAAGGSGRSRTAVEVAPAQRHTERHRQCAVRGGWGSGIRRPPRPAYARRRTGCWPR